MYSGLCEIKNANTKSCQNVFVIPGFRKKEYTKLSKSYSYLRKKRKANTIVYSQSKF